MTVFVVVFFSDLSNKKKHPPYLVIFFIHIICRCLLIFVPENFASITFRRIICFVRITIVELSPSLAQIVPLLYSLSVLVFSVLFFHILHFLCNSYPFNIFGRWAASPVSKFIYIFPFWSCWFCQWWILGISCRNW